MCSKKDVSVCNDILVLVSSTGFDDSAPLLDKDCAICKDQFSLKTEDPDEQVVVTLPCSHPFHEPCIMPWLKSSGTCPVCRYASDLFRRLFGHAAEHCLS